MLRVNWRVSEAARHYAVVSNWELGIFIRGGQCKIGYMLYVCMDGMYAP